MHSLGRIKRSDHLVILIELACGMNCTCARDLKNICFIYLRALSIAFTENSPSDAPNRAVFQYKVQKQLFRPGLELFYVRWIHILHPGIIIYNNKKMYTIHRRCSNIRGRILDGPSVYILFKCSIFSKVLILIVSE